MTSSRQPGFYRLSIRERRRFAARALGITESELEAALEAGGLQDSVADKAVENVLGTYALPFALGLNVRVNDQDFLVPMVVEEPSVVAAASHAAKIIRAGGGFRAEADASLMIGQVQLDDVPDAARAEAALLGAEQEILEIANRVMPGLVRRGGGAQGLQVRDLKDGMLVVHLIIDCRDAMGANLVNTASEATSVRIAELAGGSVGLRIQSNLCDRRLTRVSAVIPSTALSMPDRDGTKVRDMIIAASRFAERDPYRAATHNKGMMNGIDAVAIATGNDWRSVEAGVHAYAARDGAYGPLCVWSEGPNGELVGALELPLALGIVGGSSRVHAGARLGLQITGVESSQDLAMIAASVGMASNLSALRALSTEGIQRGHMALHARSVAVEAGAEDGEVDSVAEAIRDRGDFSVEAARDALREKRESEWPTDARNAPSEG